MLVLFVTLNFLFEFKTANQPGFEPGFPGPKETMLTIELPTPLTTFNYFRSILTFSIYNCLFLSVKYKIPESEETKFME